MLDWQNTLVVLILLLACLYLARRGWARLTFFLGNERESLDCRSETCGGCGTNRPAKLK